MCCFKVGGIDSRFMRLDTRLILSQLLRLAVEFTRFLWSKGMIFRGSGHLWSVRLWKSILFLGVVLVGCGPLPNPQNDLQVSATKISKDNAIVGTVRNVSQRKYAYVQIEFSLYDKAGGRIGSASDNITNLEPGSKWNFQARIFDERAAAYKLAEITGW